jgi:hypothetical protein
MTTPGRMTEAEFRSLYDRLRAQVPWGPDDRRGALNYVTPGEVLAARGEIRLGRTVSLAAPVEDRVTSDNPDPAQHQMTRPLGANVGPGLSFSLDRIAMNIHVLDRADGQEVLHDHPPRGGLPGGFQHHRPRDVSALLWHLSAAGAEPERAGSPVEQRPEHAGGVGAGQAQPLDRPVRRDQAALLAIGQEPVCGNRRECAHRCSRNFRIQDRTS